MRTAPARLGELLEKRGDLTREQLLRALRNQKVLGGRLGTCLLEIEAVTEEQLCSALAEQYGVPCATPEDLRGIGDELLELLPAKIARRCHAIAFQATSTQVKVALIDVRNLAFQDEISFVVGKRIRWHVAPELRMMEALEKHYGEECPSRLAKLLDKMNRSRFLWAREQAAATQGSAQPPAGDQLQWDSRIAGVPGAPPAANDSPASVSVELPHFQHETLDLPVLQPVPPVPPIPPLPSPPPLPTPSAAPAPPPAPPAPPLAVEPTLPPSSAAKAAKAAKVSPAKGPTGPQKSAPPTVPAVAAPAGPAPAKPSLPAAPPLASAPPAAAGRAPRKSVEETEQRLLQPRERDDVARALVDFAAGLLQRCVLFVVRKEEITAWMWSGSGLDVERLAALRLSLKQPSVFAGLTEKGASFHGRLPTLPSNLAVGACFTAPALAPEVVVLPVKVKDRLVAALLFEPRPESGDAVAPADLAALQRVIAKAEIGFELCIMRSKLRQA